MMLPERTDDLVPIPKAKEAPGTIENIFFMKQKLTVTEVIVYIQYLSGALLAHGCGTDQKRG
jgi:hypothetical protein